MFLNFVYFFQTGGTGTALFPPSALFASSGLILLSVIFSRIWKKRTKNKKPPKDYEIKQKELNKDLEPYGFAYDVKQDIFYSLMYCWQRKYGYCQLYDEAAPSLNMIIECEPIYFEYKGYQWMIELWKGQYGMNTGAEIGIYRSESGRKIHIPNVFDGTFYESIPDSDRLFMSYKLCRGKEVLFERSGVHWWLTGFVLGEYSEPEQLTMEIQITFPNLTMCDAFVNGMLDRGYTMDKIAVRYKTVYFTFDRPLMKNQPAYKYLTERERVQSDNLVYCTTYRIATRKYNHTLDKLEFLKKTMPSMYEGIIQIGKMGKRFEKYSLIKSYVEQKQEDDGEEKK